MLWNKDVLFVHYPKTAGISLMTALVHMLDEPITCYASPAQFSILNNESPDDLTLHKGTGHENLMIAQRILAGHDITPTDFKAVVVCIRNPYDLMVSNYEYMRTHYRYNKLRRNFQIAIENDFERFAELVGVAPIERWMTLDGAEPSNLSILRFEHLQQDFNRLADEIGKEHTMLPRLNRTPHRHFADYLTPRAEQAISSKFSYLFDKGYYQRRDEALPTRITSDLAASPKTTPDNAASLESASPPRIACSICGSTVFLPGPKGRSSRNGARPRCARCRSLERHRLIRNVWKSLPHEMLSDLCALQFSRDPSVDSKWFREWELSVYGIFNSLDLENIDRPDSHYDVVICNHVLEHIKDDRRAFCELMRILRESGFLQFTVPGPRRRQTTEEWGYPDPTQHGHYRLYGEDVVDRFGALLPGIEILKIRSTDDVTSVDDYIYFAGRRTAIDKLKRYVSREI